VEFAACRADVVGVARQPLKALLIDVSLPRAQAVRAGLEDAGWLLHAEHVRDADGLGAALRRRGWDAVFYEGAGSAAVPARKALALVRLADPHLPFIAVAANLRPGALSAVVKGFEREVAVVPNTARIGPIVRRELAAARERRTGGMASRLLLAQQTITDHVAAGLEPEVLGLRVLETLGQAFGWTYGALWRPDDAAGVLRCATSWHAPSGGQRVVAFSKASQDLTFAPGWGLPGRVWGFHRPQWLPDVAAESTPRARWAGRARLRSAVAFPLALADRFEGVVEFLAPDIHEPNAEVAALFATVGGQLAQYLGHHRLTTQAGGRDRAQAWIDAVAAIVVVLDRDGRVAHANCRCAAVLGRDVAGRDWFEAVVPQDERAPARAALARALASGEPEPCEHGVLAADGSSRRVAWEIAALPGGEGAVATGEDVTERQAADRLLEGLARHEARSARRRPRGTRA
jgi:PAS domain S-box-containing protein